MYFCLNLQSQSHTDATKWGFSCNCSISAEASNLRKLGDEKLLFLRRDV